MSQTVANPSVVCIGPDSACWKTQQILAIAFFWGGIDWLLNARLIWVFIFAAPITQ